MQYKLISLMPLQLARVLGLVRTIEPAMLEEGRVATWGLVERGRGFTRLLRDEPLAAPNMIRPTGWNLPRPMRFPSQRLAVNYAQSMGLLPRRTAWSIKETSDASQQ
jgi:hypothetical protein